MLRFFNISKFLERVCTRAVYFSRFLGLLSYLFVSLYALEIKYHKYEIILIILLLISFTIAIIIPLDQQIFLSNMLYKLADELSTFLASLCLKVFIILNYIIAASKNKSLTMLLTSITILAGRELLLFSYNPYFLIAGAILLLTGITIFYLKTRAYYLWA